MLFVAVSFTLLVSAEYRVKMVTEQVPVSGTAQSAKLTVVESRPVMTGISTESAQESMLQTIRIGPAESGAKFLIVAEGT